jgi:hypothetical protein
MRRRTAYNSTAVRDVPQGISKQNKIDLNLEHAMALKSITN